MTQKQSNTNSKLFQTECAIKKKMKTHLFYIEDKKVFNSADGRQNRTVKSADPANCLTVDDLQHVLRNGKLLLAPPFGQPTVTVVYDQPEGWMTPQGKRLEEQRRRQTNWNHQSHRFLFRMRHSIYAKTLRENTWINLHICQHTTILRVIITAAKHDSWPAEAERRLVEILLSGKFYKDGDGSNYDEVKDGEFVHLLAHAGLPTLSIERGVNETSENTRC